MSAYHPTRYSSDAVAASEFPCGILNRATENFHWKPAMQCRILERTEEEIAWLADGMLSVAVR